MKKEAALNLRISRETRDELQKRAEEDGRTISNYVVRVIVKHLEGRKEDK